MKNFLLQKGRDIHHSCMIWNTLGGMVSAGQSAVILMFVSYRDDITTAGMVTIAYAIASLFYVMAQYGVRNYQVTDTTEKYSFADYLITRIITIMTAMILLLIYLAYVCYTKETDLKKLAIIFEVSLWKFIDALEDVFIGQYQKAGRLDIGAKIMTLRMALSTGLTCLLTLLYVNIQTALTAGIVLSVMIDIYFIFLTFYVVRKEDNYKSEGKITGVIKDCLPLCIGSVFCTYVGNAPKYLIDQYMDEQTQAVFGYIMLPVFMIMLLNNFIYQPAVKELGDIWEQGKETVFRKKIIIQCRIVAFLTLSAILAGKFAGLPVLSVLYHKSLGDYGNEFIVLLLGGGFYALVSYLNVPLIVMGRKKYIAWGYLAAACFILGCGKYFVLSMGMMGAALLYLILNVTLAVWYLMILFYRSRKTG